MRLSRLTLLLTTVFAMPVAYAEDHPEHPKPPPPEELFKTIDANHDGVLSKDEFAQGMEALHKRMGPPPRGDDGERRPPPPHDGDNRSGEHQPPNGGGDDRRPPPPGDGRDEKSGAADHGARDGGAPKDGGAPRDGGQKKGGPGKQLDEAFTAADGDKSGTLTLEEFKAALKALRPPPRRADD